jgi:hypothetical protein
MINQVIAFMARRRDQRALGGRSSRFFTAHIALSRYELAGHGVLRNDPLHRTLHAPPINPQ